MAKFSLIGNPISHSKSPALFRAAYPAGKHTYSLLEAPTCKEAMKIFIEEGFSGTNVTSPFKDEVMEHVHIPDRISSILGSANTLISKEGRLLSYNTDYYGVKNTISDILPLCAPQLGATPPAVLVIGAGGAGKAAALAVCDMDMKVYFANRSSDSAAPFAAKIGAEYITLGQIPLVMPEVGIIIYNLSMEIEPLRHVCLQDKIVFEANYAHPNLEHKGAGTYISGRYWLYNQAIPAFRLFTGEEPDTAAMKIAVGL